MELKEPIFTAFLLIMSGIFLVMALEELIIRIIRLVRNVKKELRL